MEKPYLLHFATPANRVSPFDVNMAYDAGWDAVIPYAGVGPDEIAGFTQDAIFSRGPKGARRTGIFIGGRDALLAHAMLEAARLAMVPPFQVSVFADPSGAYTTAAAMVAKAEHAVAGRGGLNGRRVTVFGGTGPVGMVAAILAAQAGARVTIPGHDGPARAEAAVAAIRARLGLDIRAADAASEAGKDALIAETEVALCTAKAGVRVLDERHLALATGLLVAADINAVPPSGIAGIGVMDDGVALGGALAIGPLAIGNVKYKVQHGLLQAMRTTEAPVYLGFAEAMAEARRHVG
ncbi:methylenetetrahydromethanopterin dehydrogenase [Parasulfuritortus cantonensis]|uniref:Methylenetetrahydromethanopterin dehydrogenase n=2 Tax=Parasulfuritortus cantonensis TaxID=2528202 RepID=A0A4R1B371_9PROT|nr:NAD(P)-dependent methylenetetrahydromethanopterin dehydrogenase [Parasulfuritortus cantonensis]TCJ11920.1 methylenetetrahydromethanopterin dehydrogenase [Parasulfuritortus cantonensis]